MNTRAKHLNQKSNFKIQKLVKDADCWILRTQLFSNFTIQIDTMKSTIAELNKITTDYSLKISAISEQEFSAKPLPNKWSKKEVLGHLIDSAHNNLRRFVCGQYEPTPPKIVYDQDYWVKANNYQQADSKEVIAMWKLINNRIVTVLETMPASSYAKECNTGKNSVSLHSLEWLAEDYVKHLEHHLNQIIPNSFDIVYP
jgi:hypothetical protein